MHAQRICSMKEAIMKSTITATCQALLRVCVCVWCYVLRVLLKHRERRIEALQSAPLLRFFNCDDSNGTPRCCISPTAGDCFNLWALLKISSTTLAYWNLHTQVLSCFLCSLVFVKVESFSLTDLRAEIDSVTLLSAEGSFDESL